MPSILERKEVLEIPKTIMSKRGSLTSAKSLHERLDEKMDQDGKGGLNDGKNQGDEASTSAKGIRPSKSETSIIDSFVVVENEYGKKKSANALREGKFLHSKWICLRFNACSGGI